MTTQTLGPREMADDAAQQLTGTCNSLVYLGPEFEELQNNKEFCARLDELVFCCERCEWWHEQDEMASDFMCEDCTEELK